MKKLLCVVMLAVIPLPLGAKFDPTQLLRRSKPIKPTIPQRFDSARHWYNTSAAKLDAQQKALVGALLYYEILAPAVIQAMADAASDFDNLKEVAKANDMSGWTYYLEKQKNDAIQTAFNKAGNEIKAALEYLYVYAGKAVLDAASFQHNENKHDVYKKRYAWLYHKDLKHTKIPQFGNDRSPDAGLSWPIMDEINKGLVRYDKIHQCVNTASRAVESIKCKRHAHDEL